MATSNVQPNPHYLTLAGGAYTSIRDLTRLRYASREIDRIVGERAKNPLSGLMTSSFRGRGIDFAEVRNYQPGDDIRTIDWRVTARTRKPHTKLFQEEKERPVLLVVDQTQTMFFGSRVLFKSVLAAQAAALLAWTALDKGDRVGGSVYSDTEHREIRPRRSKHSVLRLVHELDSFNHQLSRENHPEHTLGMGTVLRNLRRVVKHGSAIFIISDFHGFDQEARLHFEQLAKHNDMVGVHISDLLERDLPRPDIYTITNGTEKARINTGDRQFRNAYHDNFENHISGVRQLFSRQKSPLFEIQTHLPLISQFVGAYNAWARQM
ncbi:MAG: DUF58 domain-containing protein [Pseudomonadales bacterium]|nr:DUF58 domain-containing protein [Pseudomonadales bacterium]